MNNLFRRLVGARSRELLVLTLVGLGLTAADSAAAATAASPKLSPAPGTYTSDQTLSMSDTTSGASIHYTTNGSTPTASSTKYTAPVKINGTTTVKAIAVASGFTNSAVTSGTYTIKVVSTPALAPAPGAYTSAQSISMTDATSGATIHYTTNGTTPTASSTKYTAPVKVSATTTVKAIAIAAGFGNSTVAGGTYTIKIAASPVLSPTPGTYTSVKTISMTDSTAGAVIHYTTNGSAPTANSTKYTGPITISANTTIKAIAVASGFGNSAITTGTYTIKVVSTPVLSPAPGTYTSDQTVAMSDATSGATIHYTTNGTTPTASSTKYTTPIRITGTSAVKAIAVATGFGNSALAGGTYTIKITAPPAFSPTPGTYTSVETISMIDATPGAVIYYTINGTTPSSSSTRYTTPITLTTPTKIEAIAIAPGFGPSAVTTGTYTIKIAATPVFTPSPGTYTGATSVSMSDTTAGAVIHYTTNGTTPTATSATYSTPLSIGTTTTLNAIAVAPGVGNSLVATGTYTIVLPTSATPTISPTAGTYGPSAGTSPAGLLITMRPCSSLICLFRIGQPVPTIYYTLDGSTPSASSTRYSGPFTVPVGSVTQVRAITVTAGYNNSAVASATYTVPNFPSSASQVSANGVFLISTYPANSCQYYQAIGAIINVPSGADPCQQNSDGSYTYGMTQSYWVTNVYNALLNNGVPQETALFININDLNFTRSHHMVEYGSSSAAYVCNFPGADFYHDAVAHAQGVADQAAVDQAIHGAQSNLNPLPCVAIDYGFFESVQGQAMRFMAFDPHTGNLLPAVDLDGRGAKQVPNACSACHGIPIGVGATTSGSQVPNGARYIPFDEGNLVFGTQLPQSQQEGAIKAMNQTVLNITQTQLARLNLPLASDPIYQLIHAMYDTSPCTNSAVSMGNSTQAVLPTPCGLLTTSLDEESAYWAIYAPYCRSCHVANGVNSYLPPTQAGDLKNRFGNGDVCSPLTGHVAATMPNSKVAFDRFWTTHVGPTASEFQDSDYPYFLSQFTGCTLDSFPPSIN